MKRSQNPLSIEKASRLVAERGRAFILPNGRISVQVCTKERIPLDLLKRVFGGNDYPHHSSTTGDVRLWMLGNKKDLVYLYGQVFPYVDKYQDARERLLPLILFIGPLV